MSTPTLLVLLTTFSTFLPLSTAHGSRYTLQDDLSFQNFFSTFDFFSGADPTKGFVQYQTRDEAIKNKYVGYFEDTQSVFLGVDFESKDAEGRKSVRVESKKSWNTGLLVADIRHMPDSTCGSWPAFWLLGAGEWPDAGEVDILEGVNDEVANAVTLHTTAGCAVDNITTPATGATNSKLAYSGLMTTDNCDVAAEDQGKNVGCSIKAPKPSAKNGVETYGTGFNNAGGGVYALEWTSTFMTAWFFPRDSPVYLSTFTPNATTSNSTSLDPSTFGTPLAKFSGTGCNFTESFKDLRVIFDTTFCGEWAGKVWDESCAAKTGVATCEEYVRDNPEVFKDAYWEIAGLKWYGKTECEHEKVKRQPPVRVRQPGREYRW